jgi:metallo-beta-lactamase class B
MKKTLLLGLACVALLSAQRDDWAKPFEAHRVIGNLYYVGTYDLACFLVAGDEGHILINTGLESSAPLIRSSIEGLGFRYQDVKILLNMQAHFDHVAALARSAEDTGAEVWATEADAPLLESGGKTDYLPNIPKFTPVKVARKIKDGEIIRLGKTELKVVLMPGHTRGSVGYTMKAAEGGKTYDVAIANMASINPGTVLTGPNASYPGIAQDYARSFDIQKTVPVDVWVSAHASQYGLHGKFKPGDGYDPERFVDPEGYRAKVSNYEEAYRKQLASEKK